MWLGTRREPGRVKTKVRQSRQVERGICEPVGGREEGMGRLGRTTVGRTTVNTDENCHNCKFTEGPGTSLSEPLLPSCS